MKKTLIFAAAVLAFISCQKENAYEQQKGDPLVFTAGIDDTKISLQMDETTGVLRWSSGDRVKITDAAGTTATYKASAAGRTVPLVPQDDSQPVLGAGPYTATYDGFKYNQTYSTSKLNNMSMSASSETTELTFQVTCGLLKLSVSGEGSLESIMLKGDATSLYTLPLNEGVDISSGAEFFIAINAGDVIRKIYFSNTDDLTCLKTAKTGKEISVAVNTIQPVNFTGLTAADFDCVYMGNIAASGYPLLWATKNLGAANETDSGDFFAWGETVGRRRNADNTGWVTTAGKAKNFSTAVTIPEDLKVAEDAATVILGSPWRMPTNDELGRLPKMTGEWKDNYNSSGVNGWLITYVKEGNWYNGHHIFFPAPGFGNGAGHSNPGSYGYYWSSEAKSTSAIYDFRVYYDSTKDPATKCESTTTTNLKLGFNIRPVKE